VAPCHRAGAVAAFTMRADALVERLAACPGCGDARLTRLATPGHWIGAAVFEPHAGRLGLCRCAGCGLVFVNPRPTAALLGRFYQGDGYVCHQADASDGAAATARVQLDQVERLVPGRGRFLDYGCGGGYLLRAAVERGWDALGFDIGAGALAACRRQRLPVTDDLAEVEARRFDAVYLSHVFEHVAEPAPLLERLARRLAPGGRLFVEVPNARSLRARLSAPALSRWAGFDERYRAFPIHLFYYSPATLRAALERAGLAVVGRATTGFGLDELFFHDEQAASGDPLHGARRRRPRAFASLRRGGRRVAGAAFLRLGLGENLVMAAGRQQPPLGSRQATSAQ